MKLTLKQAVAAIILVLSFFVAASSLDAEAKSFKWNCTYPKYASPEGLKSVSNFRLEFAFDDITGKAVMIGNSGVSDVDIHVGNSGVTFLEKLIGGAVQTTIIAKDGSSVHSRHSVISGTIIPSQYYGRCVMQ